MCVSKKTSQDILKLFISSLVSFTFFIQTSNTGCWLSKDVLYSCLYTVVTVLLLCHKLFTVLYMCATLNLSHWFSLEAKKENKSEQKLSVLWISFLLKFGIYFTKEKMFVGVCVCVFFGRKKKVLSLLDSCLSKTSTWKQKLISKDPLDIKHSLLLENYIEIWVVCMTLQILFVALIKLGF